MSKRIIDELRAKRADAIKNMQAFAEEANGEPMGAELMAKFKAAEAECDNYDAQIKALKKAEAEATEEQFEDVTAPDGNNSGFLNYLRTGDRSGVQFENAVGTGAASAGAIVPVELAGQIIKAMYDYGAVLGLADVITIGGNVDMAISGTEPTAYWTPENAAYTASEPTLGKITLTPHKLTSLILASEELVDDAAFDIESYIAERSGIAMGRAVEDAFLNNTGSTAPLGMLVSASVGVTAASTGHTFTYGEVVTLYTSVKGPYRRPGAFLVSDAALKAVMLLTDGDGRYVFQPSYTEGMPDKLLSKPVHTSEYMAETMTAGAKPILFGDFKQYKIGMRKAITAQRLIEKYADSGQVGFRFYMRLDGKLANGNAIKALKLS